MTKENYAIIYCTPSYVYYNWHYFCRHHYLKMSMISTGQSRIRLFSRARYYLCGPVTKLWGEG